MDNPHCSCKLTRVRCRRTCWPAGRRPTARCSTKSSLGSTWTQTKTYQVRISATSPAAVGPPRPVRAGGVLVGGSRSSCTCCPGCWASELTARLAREARPHAAGAAAARGVAVLPAPPLTLVLVRRARSQSRSWTTTSSTRAWTPHRGLSPNKNGPNQLGLWCNMLPWHQMAVITSGCAPVGLPTRGTPHRSRPRCWTCCSRLGTGHGTN